jgi:hypothetical protein
VSIFSATLKSAITPSFIGGDYIPRRPTQHIPGFASDSDDLTGILIDGDDRGLVDDNALATRENQSVGCAEVDGEVGRE